MLLVLGMRTIIDDTGFFYCCGDLCGNWKDSVVVMNNSFHLLEICTQSFSKKWRGIALLALILVCIATEVTNAIPLNHIVYAVSPSLTISPTSTVYKFSSIRIKGFHYAVDEIVNVYWNYSGPGTGILKTSTTTDATGAFFTKFPIPLAPTGTYTIAGIGQTSGSIATGTFQLLPALFVNPPGGVLGTKITLTGHAFAAGETVPVYWNYTGPGTGTLLSTATAGSDGSFKTTAFVPTGGTTPGHIPIVGTGQTSNTTGTFSFLLYPPTLALAPLKGSANSVLTLSAYGFGPNETVNIYWNNDTTPVLVTSTNAIGYVASATIIVPADAVPGVYTLTAIGQKTQFTNTNTFTVVAPGFNLSISSGPVGVSVRVSGQGYAPNEVVKILWNYTGPGTGTNVATMTAGSSGIISASFIVPTESIGTYTVAAIGATDNSVSQSTFTVGNGLAASPSTDPPGNSVTVSGTGFQANEPVLLYWDSTSNTPLDTTTADAHGNSSQTVELPSTATPGVHNLIGLGQTSQQSFTATVTIDTSWGDFGFKNANQRENPFENSVGLPNVANLQRKWMAATAKGLEDSPVYANGIVYIVTPDGLLNAYNATSGNLIWRFTPGFGFPNYSSPLVDPATNMVFFGTVSNFSPGAPSPFYALDAQTGNLKWSLILPWDVYGFPTLAFNTIYIGTSHEKGPGTVHAIDEISGRVIWQYSTGGGVWGAVGVDANTQTVFTGIGNPTNSVVALNAKTGAFIWQYAVPNSGKDDDPGSGITVANGLIYVNSKNGNVYALNEITGAFVWSTRIGAQSNGNVSTQAVAANGMLYVGSLDNNLYALDAASGAIVWKIPTGGGIYSSPALANGVVYFASLDKKMYAADAATGALLWNYSTGGPIYSSPIIANGWLYNYSGDGNLYAFSL